MVCNVLGGGDSAISINESLSEISENDNTASKLADNNKSVGKTGLISKLDELTKSSFNCICIVSL